ncbi:MAG: GNAT family N-acetyltransferase [Rhizobium sp.]|nr:MAG: GNAT family N-acetyltransferase [Rhizobium sp.]
MACEIRPALEADAESISAVILEALRETNARDYAPHVIARVAESFSPAGVRELLRGRTVFVAIDGGNIVGTASLDDAVVRTVFVSPSKQRRGIGACLMAAIEQTATARGITSLSVPSSITAQGFYEKLGFTAVKDSFHGDERTIVMERRLTS